MTGELDRSTNTISTSSREFLAASTAFRLTIVPRYVLGGPGQTPPSERPKIAGIGCGGMVGGDIAKFTRLGANFIALCDVDVRLVRDWRGTAKTSR